MCGRFALFSNIDVILQYADLIDSDMEWTPHYNVSPGMFLPVLAANGRKLQLSKKKWGFIPSFAYYSENEERMFSIINAKAETISEKASFRCSFKNKRCLIPANGFYEWRKSDRHPFYITLKDQPLLLFAGIWNTPPKKMKPAEETFAIITTTANETLMPLHQRMPLIINPDKVSDWLFNPGQNNLKELLLPYPGNDMEIRPVSKEVNYSKIDHAGLISSIE